MRVPKLPNKGFIFKKRLVGGGCPSWVGVAWESTLLQFYTFLHHLHFPSLHRPAAFLFPCPVPYPHAALLLPCPGAVDLHQFWYCTALLLAIPNDLHMHLSYPAPFRAVDFASTVILHALG